ncbi:hypothetical protein ACSYAY_00990 [Leptospirillum ferriphilum]|uniref:hypothetical protein n=1 Tax=Leptospirillum ferriphilum TaxID=178606 RepID=UPI003EE63B5C
MPKVFRGFILGLLIIGSVALGAFLTLLAIEKYDFWDWVTESGFTDWLIAVGTNGAVIVAIFLTMFWEPYKKWQTRPILKIGINFEPPDCQSIPLVTSMPIQSRGPIPNYQFRIYVKNIGKEPASNLEAIIIKVFKSSGDKKWDLLPQFIATDLLWTHIRVPFLPFLLPGLTKNIDLGHVVKPEFRLYIGEGRPNADPQKTIFSFDIQIRPNNDYQKILPGVYKFLIVVGAENCESVEKIFYLRLTGEWFDTEEEMFSRGIFISDREKDININE